MKKALLRIANWIDALFYMFSSIDVIVMFYEPDSDTLTEIDRICYPFRPQVGDKFYLNIDGVSHIVCINEVFIHVDYMAGSKRHVIKRGPIAVIAREYDPDSEGENDEQPKRGNGPSTDVSHSAMCGSDPACGCCCCDQDNG